MGNYKYIPIGARFGRWEVIEIPDDNKFLFCRCDCGTEKNVHKSILRSGNSKSCGCLRRELKFNKEDLTGQRFERLLVIEKDTSSDKTSINWVCRCDCGMIVVRIYHLKNGNTKSCGCYNRDLTIKRNIKNKKYEDGDSGSKIYNSWSKMMARCYKKNKDSKDYGDRGIKVCEEWHDFLNFKEWSLKNGVKEDLSIDRIDVNGNYEPENCRWTDDVTQANNKRNNRRITIFGETKTLEEWSRVSGLGHKTITYRIDHNWPDEKILGKPYAFITR